MLERKTLSIFALLTAMLIGEISVGQVVSARGFGGGRGGGFDRGDYGRGDYGRGDGWGNGGFAGGDAGGRIDKSYYGDDHAYDPGATQKPLATDGAFGRFAGDQVAKNADHPVMGSSAVNGSAVRNAYNNHDAFDSDWWAAHRYGCYYPWMNGGYCWGYTSWPMMAGFMGMGAATYPAAYDYGNNITYQGDNVYYGSQPVATAAQYSEQATTLAELAPPEFMPVHTGGQELPKLKPENEKNWKPLGVFSLVQGGQTDSSQLFQLMVNKEGYIHGNYYDMMANEVKPVIGAIDKKSMRAAWKVHGVKDVVYDTGFSNLLKQEGPILIHFGKEKTQQWNLVRLEKPDKTKAFASKASATPEKTTPPTTQAAQ